MRRTRGAAFLLSLVITAGLVAVVASLAASQHLAMKAEINRMEARRARLAAEAGIQRAIAELALSQLTTDQTDSSGASTGSGTASGTAATLQDSWATLGTAGADRFVVGSGSCRLQIVDAGSFVNLNSATEEQLQRLPLTQEQISSLLDWRSANTEPRPDGGKDEYYNNLNQPYNAKLRDLDTLDELLLVKGFTARDIFEVPTNQMSTNPLPNLPDGRQPAIADIVTVDSYSTQTNPEGQAKININQPNVNAGQLQSQARISPGGAASIIQSRSLQPNSQFTGLGQILSIPGLSPNDFTGILDYLTIDPAPNLKGKINLNTATQTVLETIPNMTPDVAQSIIQRQSTGFTRLSDLLQVPGLNNAEALRGIVDAFTVSSRIFLVRVVGEAGDTRVALEATVDLRGTTPRISKMTEPPFADMATRWGWPDQTTTETVLKEAP